MERRLPPSQDGSTGGSTGGTRTGAQAAPRDPPGRAAPGHGKLRVPRVTAATLERRHRPRPARGALPGSRCRRPGRRPRAAAPGLPGSSAPGNGGGPAPPPRSALTGCAASCDRTKPSSTQPFVSRPAGAPATPLPGSGRWRGALEGTERGDRAGWRRKSRGGQRLPRPPDPRHAAAAGPARPLTEGRAAAAEARCRTRSEAAAMFPLRQDGAEPPAPPPAARAAGPARPGPARIGRAPLRSAPLGPGPRPPARAALRPPLSPLAPRPAGGGGGAVQKNKS